MEKKAPNLLNNLKNNGFNPQRKSVLVFKCLILLAFVLNFTPIHAQNIGVNEINPQVLEVNLYITSLKQSEQSSRSRNLQSVHLEKLLNDVQPATYVNSRDVKTYGERPNSLFIDINSLNSINNSNINKNNIEIITIKIKSKSDLNRPIDLSVFSNYPKLKYVYIISNVETDENTIKQSIKNNNAQYGVFYKIDKES